MQNQTKLNTCLKHTGQIRRLLGENATLFDEIVYRQNNNEAIEKIINLTIEYGKERIEEAKEILSKKAVDNPKRTFRYAIGIIKSSRIK
jgi:hypothetical protein